jgi:hypothetical protein
MNWVGTTFMKKKKPEEFSSFDLQSCDKHTGSSLYIHKNKINWTHNFHAPAMALSSKCSCWLRGDRFCIEAEYDTDIDATVEKDLLDDCPSGHDTSCSSHGHKEENNDDKDEENQDEVALNFLLC